MGRWVLVYSKVARTRGVYLAALRRSKPQMTNSIDCRCGRPVTAEEQRAARSASRRRSGPFATSFARIVRVRVRSVPAMQSNSAYA